MNAIIDIRGGGNGPARLNFLCPECGHSLYEHKEDITLLVHPEREDALMFKGKQIKCSWAGRKFKRPTITLVELGE